MPELKLKQLEFESDAWKRLLHFIIDENIHLKNRLSEILKNQFDKDKLETIETFQSKFLKQDDLNSLLRNEIAEFDKLLVRELLEDSKIINKVNRKRANLNSSIVLADDNFRNLKTEFNNFLKKIVDETNRKNYLTTN
jgi:hypothetical protein